MSHRLHHRTYDPSVEKVVPKDAIVLDLDDPAEFVRILRGVGLPGRPSEGDCKHIINGSRNARRLSVIADQIEAQTKPARIPEPGPWGVVSTQNDDDLTDYWTSGPGGWFNERGEVSEWHDLIDPVLIRDGVVES